MKLVFNYAQLPKFQLADIEIPESSFDRLAEQVKTHLEARGFAVGSLTVSIEVSGTLYEKPAVSSTGNDGLTGGSADDKLIREDENSPRPSPQ